MPGEMPDADHHAPRDVLGMLHGGVELRLARGQL
jgi:hypothetical protein